MNFGPNGRRIIVIVPCLMRPVIWICHSNIDIQYGSNKSHLISIIPRHDYERIWNIYFPMLSMKRPLYDRPKHWKRCWHNVTSGSWNVKRVWPPQPWPVPNPSRHRNHPNKSKSRVPKLRPYPIINPKFNVSIKRLIRYGVHWSIPVPVVMDQRHHGTYRRWPP